MQAPYKVTDLTLTWITDYKHRLNWTNNDTGERPYEKIWIDRWDNVTDTWTTIAVLGDWATSYTDRSTIQDRAYRYRIDAENAEGTSGHVYTEYTYNTPIPPVSLAWSRVGDDLVLTWKQTTLLPVETDIDFSTYSGSSWSAWVDLADVAPGIETWTHVGAPASNVTRYRIRNWVQGAVSSWVQSVDIPALGAPQVPANLSLNGETVDNQAGPTTVTWTHRPVDGTAQTAYQLRYKIDGVVQPMPPKTTSPLSQHTFPVGTFDHGSTVEWTVQTWGRSLLDSDISAAATFTTGAKPVATINVPAAGVDFGFSTLVAAWSYFDMEATAQAAAVVTLTDSLGRTLHTSTIDGPAASFQLPVTLANDTTYRLSVRVRDGSGLWSDTVTREFTTAFIPPPAPSVLTLWDEDLGTVNISITNPESVGWGTVPAVGNQIWRSIDGGPFELIADQIPLNTTVTDRMAATHGTNTYRVEAVSVTPSTAETVAVVTTSSAWLFVSGGADYSTVARLKGGVAVAQAMNREKVLHRFAGRTSPVEFIGEARSRVFQVTGSVDGQGLVPGLGPWDAWTEVADLPAPLLYRDPQGRRLYCSIGDVSVSHTTGSKYAKVSFTVTEVER